MLGLGALTQCEKHGLSLAVRSTLNQVLGIYSDDEQTPPARTNLRYGAPADLLSINDIH